MKIINDIIMSIKKFLDYFFKDDDPISTDLFDANWGNGVTKLLRDLETSSGNASTGSGVSSLSKSEIFKVGNVVHTSISGTLSASGGNKVLCVIPVGFRPTSGVRTVCVVNQSGGAPVAQAVIVYPGNGEVVAEAVPNQAHGQGFQLNISYII
ncbi:hypothetical protein [Erysipelothrix anatis]|uniref:hypothetical protein n=1 Tax=Erysipelothrix anatis TaxID=2683713 RepID=UPI0013588243|nr:hypothetical protein [Erysipelothrix anatis]